MTSKSDVYKESIDNNFGSIVVYKILLILGGIIPSIIVSLMLSLLNFHTYLGVKGMTTFEWIINQRKKSNEKRVKANTLEMQRKKRSNKIEINNTNQAKTNEIIIDVPKNNYN